jgi:glycosyltransferase involved in cell wall biosynthesis
MPRLPLSISIVSMNEETNLRRCLESVADLASEIVVVDSGSTDKTCDVAREFGAVVHYQKWLGHRDQKGVALGLCTQPWVLVLDCDEEVSAELRASIIRFFERGDTERFDAAWMNRKTWYHGRWITHGDCYPDRKLRLLKREHAKAGGEPEHDKFVLSGPNETTRLEGDLLHYSFKDMSHYLRKQIEFTEAFALRERGAGHGFSLPQTLFRAWWRFFRAYVLRLGFLDGFPGLWIAGATGFFAFVRYSRTFEDQARRDA